ncbi:MAG: cation diffusion facilitator family transporter [Desulfohalobiaceae bacterium]
MSNCTNHDGTTTPPDQGNTGHDHHGLHGHHHHGDTSGRNLLITLVLNLIIPIAQIIGGIMAGSVALVSDAMHNFSDFTALVIAFVAHKLGRKRPSLSYTFGYRRAEVLAALINVTLLVGASIFILSEIVDRLRDPQPVSGLLVVLIAGIGVLGNGFSAILLHRGSGENLNIRGAFLHMVADFMTSVVVMINGLILMFRPWYWLDPVLSLFIVFFILKNCWSIIKVVAAILMEAVPSGLDLEEVKSALEEMDGVHRVHHLHAWNVGSSVTAFSCQADLDDRRLSQVVPLIASMQHLLRKRFSIDHAVIQPGIECCGLTDSVLCDRCELDLGTRG